jgi:sugar (pentulose or hexulose) kinase
MTTQLLLGLDAGTTAVKAAVFDAAGTELAHGRAPTPWRPVSTGAELDPDALLQAAVAAASQALAAAPAGEVAGVGVASMAETGVLIDGRGRPAVPAIAWHDSRGSEQAQRLARDVGAESFSRRTGLPVRPLCTLVKYAWMREHWPQAQRLARDVGAESFSRRTGLPVRPLCTLVKYAWMREHWPQAQRGVRWLNVAEWIVRGLGGDEAAESSLASRTGFYELHERRPWDEVLAWAAAPPGLAPPHTAAGTPLGTVGDALPRARGATLAVGGHDHLAAAVGAGAAADGDVLDSCGTAEAWIRACAPVAPERVAEAVANGITVGWHALEGRQALLGSIRSGVVLSAVLAVLGVAPEERDEIEEQARHVEPAGLEISGFHDQTLTVTGLDASASPTKLYRAALESLGAAGAEVLARMDAVAGARARLLVTGGWAAGEAAREVKARHLGEFEYRPALWTGARGAALAAGRAARLWSHDREPAGFAAGGDHAGVHVRSAGMATPSAAAAYGESGGAQGAAGSGRKEA